MICKTKNYFYQNDRNPIPPSPRRWVAMTLNVRDGRTTSIIINRFLRLAFKHTPVLIFFFFTFASLFLYLIFSPHVLTAIDTKGVDVLCYNIFTSVAEHKGARVPARNYDKTMLHNRIGHQSINLDKCVHFSSRHHNNRISVLNRILFFLFFYSHPTNGTFE